MADGQDDKFDGEPVPEVVMPDGTAVPVEPAVTPAPEPEPKKDERTDWRILELGQTRRQLEEERAARERLEAENRRLTELAQATFRRESPPAEPTPRQPQPELPVDVERQIQQGVEERLTNQQAAQLDAELRRDFAEEYKTVLENFGNVGNSMQVMFKDIMATGDGAYVTSVIGKDPYRLRELRDMPQVMRLAALLRISAEKPAATPEAPKVEPSRPSTAPPPPAPAPVGGAPSVGGGTNLYDERYNFINYYNGDINRELEADSKWNAERKRQKMNSTGRMWSLPQNK